MHTYSLDRPAQRETRGAPEVFILCCSLHCRQQCPVRLIGRVIEQAAVRAIVVLPIDVLGQTSAGCAHAVMGQQAEPFVPDRAPQPFHEYDVTSGPFAIKGQATAMADDGIGELLGGELAALGGINDLRHTVVGNRLLDYLAGMARPTTCRPHPPQP